MFTLPLILSFQLMPFETSKKNKKQNKNKKNCHLKTVHYVMACSQVKVKNKNKFFRGVTAAPPLKSKEDPKFVSLSLKL